MIKSEDVFITNSFKETQRLGEEFARFHLARLKCSIIALYGELGSGKTTFVQGLAKGLGIKKRIISPTFIIVRSYVLKSQKSKVKSQNHNSKLKSLELRSFYHIDLYRISSEKDIGGLGLEEVLNSSSNIVAIEWAEKMGRFLPRKRIDIRFVYLSERKRRITVGNLKSQIAKLKTTT